jgi:hypothetical protein
MFPYPSGVGLHSDWRLATDVAWREGLRHLPCSKGGPS